jgi:MoxR-vWA-beta-propeller ternary system protein
MHRSGVNPGSEQTGLASFVRLLGREGRAVVSREETEGREEEALSALAEWEARARAELAGEPPAFSPSAALWAARIFQQACRCTVCRDLDADFVKTALDPRCPAARGPETDWSVDLIFRHLPDLFRFGRELSNADPLVAALKSLAAAWPLSSVGMADLPELSIDSFFGHPALRRLYGDRILAAGDLSRLGDPRVADLLRADLGWHRELAPVLARRLFPEFP